VLGQSQISLTMGTYSHVVAPLLRDAADKMETSLQLAVESSLARATIGAA
jgi:hypothetical protein